MKKRERSLEELYRDDPERADALLYNRKTGTTRRGFLGGAGVAAMGAMVGGSIPFSQNMPAGFVPAAFAQATAPAAPEKKGPQFLEYPGKDKGLVVIGDRPLVAETPEHLLDDDTTPTAKFFIRNNGNMPEEPKQPDAWKLAIDGEVNKPLELTLGESEEKLSSRRPCAWCWNAAATGARSISPPDQRQPVDQRRRGLRGMDRRFGLSDVLKDGGRQAVRHLHRRITARTRICPAIRSGSRFRAVCGSPKRWSRNACWCGR
jgi:hypothetical protein